MLKFRTVQSSALKTLFEVLKDVLNDVNLVFNQDGIKLVAMDSSHVALVYMFLEAENFEPYVCDKEYVLGMNMLNMYKILRIIGTNDVLDMSLEDETELTLNIKVTNAKKKTTTTFKVKLLDIDDPMLDPPDLKLTSVTPMPSADFQKFARDMGNLGHELDVNITKNAEGLLFKCNGDFAFQETFIENENNSSVEVSNDYSLKYINTFAKASNLCPTVQLFLEPNYPLIMRYEVAQLGDICFCLASRVTQ
jgi:proliferating cell nuclear antigen